MKNKFLTPYRGIIYFLCLLFLFHFSWKILIDGDMGGNTVWFCGRDVTPAWFMTLCRWFTSAAAWFIRLFPGSENLIVSDQNLHWQQGGGMWVVWGCTGVKQLTIFCGIMIFYRCYPFARYQWNKLWYIPLGCIILTAYNVVRMGSIVLLVKGHPEKFESLHDGIFRYIYYTIIFIIWVIWEERWVRTPSKRSAEQCK